MPEIVIPYAPRATQLAMHQAMERTRFGAAVCHRRFGKSVWAINHLQKAALTSTKPRPRYAYIGPTYRQSKQTVWDYLKFYARPVTGTTFNESELRADYPNGGQVRLYGGDNPDSLRGLYLDGVVVDEYGLHQSDLFTTVLRPALSDREGWAMFLGTPNGKNQFYDIIKHAAGDPSWFHAIHKASETGIISPSELRAARQVMTQDEYDQEFECSFDAAVKGSIYAKEIDAARSEGRITSVPHDPILPVSTVWDLGVGDATAIWFVQSLRGGEVRLIDYYEASGEGLPHYAEMLRRKAYAYGQHWAPHDIQVRELASGRSRLEVAESLGIKFEVVPSISFDDGIHAARMLFPRCWFDRVKCDAGLEALTHYRKDYNTRIREFKASPVHDWASHGADAWRYLAVSQQAPTEKRDTASMLYPSNSSWMG